MILCASRIPSSATSDEDPRSSEQNIDKRRTVILNVVEALEPEKSLKTRFRHPSENLAPGGVSSELFEGV